MEAKEQPEDLEFQVTIGSLLKVVDYVVEYHKYISAAWRRWKRAGPIGTEESTADPATPRSLDRDKLLLIFFFFAV